MLTKAQIQRIAQRNGVGMQVQERDYVQHLILWLLYSHSQGFIFKGGTSLRLVYKGNRYSEDLDFNGPDDVAAQQSLWDKVVAGLEDFGIVAKARGGWTSNVGYSFDVSFRGPLHDGRDRSKGKVRVDVSLRAEDVEARRELVTSEYDDVRPFVVTVLNITEPNLYLTFKLCLPHRRGRLTGKRAIHVFALFPLSWYNLCTSCTTSRSGVAAPADAAAV
jgi:hypothetical protein